MPKERSKCAVIGASGYAGEELVRLLLAHPIAELVAITSRQSGGKRLDQVFPRFAHHNKGGLLFSDADAKKISQSATFVFLALPHGVSADAAQSFLDCGAR